MSRKYRIIRAIVLALVLFGVGVMLYQGVVEAEESGTAKSMNIVLAIAYQLGGKWAVVGTWTAFACMFVLLSLRWTGERV